MKGDWTIWTSEAFTYGLMEAGDARRALDAFIMGQAIKRRAQDSIPGSIDGRLEELADSLPALKTETFQAGCEVDLPSDTTNLALLPADDPPKLPTQEMVGAFNEHSSQQTHQVRRRLGLSCRPSHPVSLIPGIEE